MFTKMIGRITEAAKSERVAKIALKLITAGVAAYFGTELSPDMVAYIGAGYLALASAIDAWWDKKYPTF